VAFLDAAKASDFEKYLKSGFDRALIAHFIFYDICIHQELTSGCVFGK